jgi:hypothetical protein
MTGYEGSIDRTPYTEGTRKDFQIGYFFRNEDTGELGFLDAQGKIISLSRISFITGFSNVDEGTKNFPKPAIVTNTGEMKEYGERVAYSYINSYDGNILIHGVVRQVMIDNADPELRIDPDDIANLLEKVEVRNNEERYYYIKDDGKGNVIVLLKGKKQNGNISLKVKGGEGAGNLKVELSGKMLLNITGEEDEVIARQYWDKEKFKFIDRHKNELAISETGVSLKDKFENKIETTETGYNLTDKNGNKYTTTDKGTAVESPRIDLKNKDGESAMKILSDFIDAVLAMTQPTAAGGPTMPAKFNQADFVKIKDRISKFMKV